MIYISETHAQKPEPVGDQWLFKNLNHITVILGKNGSGKSRALRSIGGGDQITRHMISPERSGEIQPQPQFAQDENSGSTRFSYRNVNSPNQFRERTVSRISSYLIKKGIANDIVPKEKIEGFMKTLMPEFDFKIMGEGSYYTLTRSSNAENISSKEQLSSGEVSILIIGIDILTICSIWALEQSHERVLLIDEPDVHLHPDLQRQLADFLVSIMHEYETQLVVTTHSTALLASLGHYGVGKTSVIYLNPAERTLPARVYTKHLGRMSTLLGGGALLGPLFNLPMLLVEGNDDFQVWNQAARSQAGPIVSTIDCGGSGEIPRYKTELTRILDATMGAATKASGFTLKDGDNLSQPRRSGISHIIDLRIVCLELENLYLTDEVIHYLGYPDWSAVALKLQSDASQYPGHETTLIAASTWDRSNQDIKSAIKVVNAILCPSEPWQLSLGRVIGKQKPEGMLFEFLGEGVVNSLWPDDSNMLAV